MSADGPANILAAVRTAASGESIGKGVTVCLGDRIYAAWDVTKVHTTNPDTFRDLHYGPIGTVYGSRVEYGRIPVKHKKIHTDRIEEDIWIITCWSGMDGGIVYGAEGKAAGLVIDGIGCGNVPPKCRKAVLYLREKGMPIVLTTRVPSGSVEEEYSYEGSALSMKDSGIILGGRLSSWKARLLLALAMGKQKYRRNQKLLLGDQGRIENHCGTRNPFSNQSWIENIKEAFHNNVKGAFCNYLFRKLMK